MKIGFYSPHITLGGTEITLYDFADYNEKILGNESIIIYNEKNEANNPSAIKKFEKRFDKIFKLKGPEEDWCWKGEITVPLLDRILLDEKCDAVYMQKFGHNDGVISNVCKSLILCAAPVCEPHGDVYAYVSEWLSEEASGGRYPAVPSMITPLPTKEGDLRGELGIPTSARVFGRTGGKYGWNLPWSDMVIKHVLENAEDVYFVFQNTDISFSHDRILHVEASADLKYKAEFINTCDAMIHARVEGESFGCACGEFSSLNKPIITWSLSKDRNHIKILGDKGIYYKDAQEMYEKLINFKPEPEKNWNCYDQFKPEVIMNTFNKIFLQ